MMFMAKYLRRNELLYTVYTEMPKMEWIFE